MLTILYDAEAQDIDIRDGRFISGTVACNGKGYTVRASALVLASGGFQANRQWLRNSERFYDEGQEFWPKRYPIWGHCPDRRLFWL